jgi:hypothetical protein
MFSNLASNFEEHRAAVFDLPCVTVYSGESSFAAVLYVQRRVMTCRYIIQRRDMKRRYINTAGNFCCILFVLFSHTGLTFPFQKMNKTILVSTVYCALHNALSPVINKTVLRWPYGIAPTPHSMTWWWAPWLDSFGRFRQVDLNCAFSYMSIESNNSPKAASLDQTWRLVEFLCRKRLKCRERRPSHTHGQSQSILPKLLKPVLCSSQVVSLKYQGNIAGSSLQVWNDWPYPSLGLPPNSENKKGREKK